MRVRTSGRIATTSPVEGIRPLGLCRGRINWRNRIIWGLRLPDASYPVSTPSLVSFAAVGGYALRALARENLRVVSSRTVQPLVTARLARRAGRLSMRSSPKLICQICVGVLFVLGVGLLAQGLIIDPMLPDFQLDVVLTLDE